MSAGMTASKVLVNLARFMGKFLLNAIVVVLEVASESKKPICGAAEAYGRRERGSITPDEFYKATNQF